LWSTTAAPTTTFIKSYEAAAENFDEIKSSIKTVDDSIKQVEITLERFNAPYTPGRLPDWKKSE
jgi:hypothetical protein